MRIGIIGINHKQASLILREQIAKLCQQRFADERIIHPYLSYVLLSTCNRTELYFCGSDLPAVHGYLLAALCRGGRDCCEQKIYSYFGVDCFRHLARVTAGLDSALLGESEIQRQVKQAYETARQRRKLPSELHFLFQKSLKIAKAIRTHYPVKKVEASLPEIVYHFARYHLGPLENKKLLFIGVSRINQTILGVLRKKAIGLIACCNRTLAKAEALGLPCLPWEAREQWQEFDMIVVGTTSPYYLIDAYPHGMKQQKVIIDLSVPRNVAPTVGEHPCITLFNIDQLVKWGKQQSSCTPFLHIDYDHIEGEVQRQMFLFDHRRQKASWSLQQLV